MTENPRQPEISIIVPVLNERETVDRLFEEVKSVFENDLDRTYEMIFVDDGSSDGSWEVMCDLVAREPVVRAVRLRTNFGKATALSLGFARARGDVYVTMDADLQDDPVEIPRFLKELDDGFDLVTGWKKNRHDPLSKTIPSKIFNFVTSAVCGLKLRDFNCGFKAGRKEVFNSLNLYGELHRYIPVMANDAGFRVGEISVLHHPRRFGKSKYGVERYLRGFLDLLTVVTLTRFGRRPGHLFGGVGVVSGIVGGAILTYLAILRFAYGELIGDRPLLLFGAMLSLVAIQFVLFGMLAELILHRTRVDNEASPVAEDAEPE